MALVIFVVSTFAAALMGAQFMPGEWYAALKKPGWTPPGWLFGPVWTVLYCMIAAAGWLVWRSGQRQPALTFWIAGLVLNGAWSWLFFGKRWMGVAFADIVLLWLTIAGFIWATWRTNATASYLFIPYFAWVSFATALNFAIWRLNA